MAGRFISGRTGLTDAEARGLSPAHARVVQSMAGRLRALYEMATGQAIVAGEMPSIPRNPQGLLGVDFSGPPYGSAWRHPLGGSGGLKPDTVGAGAWEGHQTQGSCVAGSRLIIPICLYVRPHVGIDRAPYTRGYPIVSLYQATAVAGFSVTLTCIWGEGEGARRSATATASSTAEVLRLPDVWWDLHPGRNNLRLELETASATAAILARFTINQMVKREHA